MFVGLSHIRLILKNVAVFACYECFFTDRQYCLNKIGKRFKDFYKQSSFLF